MKQPRNLDEVEREMRPGVITRDGFLGTDDRHLIDILAEDGAEVRRLGLTHAGMAERMAEFSEAGRRGLGEPIKVPPHYEVRVDSVRGKLPCPFHGGFFHKTNTTVSNLNIHREITYTDLNVHMIREHGFYEGKGSPFRIDPAELAEVLDMTPEAPQTEIP